MAYQHKEGQGSLFPNQKTNLNQPDLKGSIMLGGILYDISAWNTTSQSGKQYVSLRAVPHQDRQPQGNVQYSQVPPIPCVKEEPSAIESQYSEPDYFAPENPAEPDLPF